MPDTDKSVLQRAEDLFVARTTAADGKRPFRRLGIAELYEFLVNPKAELTSEQQRLLFADARLRADFQRLKQDLVATGGGITLPRVAAASDGALSARVFQGGKLEWDVSEGFDDQVWVVLNLDDHSRQPAALVLTHPDGEISKLEFDQPPDEGTIEVLVDTSIEKNATVIRLLRDARSEVTIQWR